jgi:hypothetical protein
MVGIVVVLGVLLCLEKTLADVGDEGVAVVEQCVDRLRMGCAGGMWEQRWRGLTVDDLEGRCAECRVEGGVVAVLRPGEPVDPGSWTVSHGAPLVHDQHLVDDLRLPVRLGVEGYAEAKLSWTPANLNRSRHMWLVKTGLRSLTMDIGKSCS